MLLGHTDSGELNLSIHLALPKSLTVCIDCSVVALYRRRTHHLLLEGEQQSQLEQQGQQRNEG
jgi:hypothetical protein